MPCMNAHQRDWETIAFLVRIFWELVPSLGTYYETLSSTGSSVCFHHLNSALCRSLQSENVCETNTLRNTYNMRMIQNNMPSISTSNNAIYNVKKKTNFDRGFIHLQVGYNVEGTHPYPPHFGLVWQCDKTPIDDANYDP